MRISWTRDEVILGLDVLFSNESKSLSMDSEAIIELSQLLNRLPLIPMSKRNDKFRNAAGVRRQLLTFEWSLKAKKKASHVGQIFYQVYSEYEGNLAELQDIAQAIRRNEALIHANGCSILDESTYFPEGKILHSLHRSAEWHEGARCGINSVKCAICCIQPEQIYSSLSRTHFFETHLLIPPTKMSPDMEYWDHDFIAVCPNCHRMLHQFRPWLSRNQCQEILLNER